MGLQIQAGRCPSLEFGQRNDCIVTISKKITERVETLIGGLDDTIDGYATEVGPLVGRVAELGQH